MRWVCRCPFCDKVIASANDDREAFRTLILAHLMKCNTTSPNLSFLAAALIAHGLIDEMTEVN